MKETFASFPVNKSNKCFTILSNLGNCIRDQYNFISIYLQYCYHTLQYVSISLSDHFSVLTGHKSGDKTTGASFTVEVCQLCIYHSIVH